MKSIQLPYGTGQITLELPADRLAGVLVSKAHKYKRKETESVIVEKALASPINSLHLRELVKTKDKVVIISSDHTRPVPSYITTPLLLQEIRKGNPASDITILIATGYHRSPTEYELRKRFGDRIVNQEKIVVHDAFREEEMVNLGKLPSGGDLLINKLAVEADLLIAEGFIEPHFFAGFSGGRKSVLPGIAGKETVLANHCAQFIAHNKARTGILDGNPIHKDMTYAAEKAGLAFILNVVIDEEKRIIAAFAGHFDKAHREGCALVERLATVTAVPSDIVITTNGGSPLDQNIYQSVKCMTAAEASCKKHGVIIVASQCADGHGGEGFYSTFAQAASAQEIMGEIMKRIPSQTVPDQWESQVLARILMKHQVIMVTDAPREMVENMLLKWVPSIENALELAEEITGNKKAKVTVIPDGVSVIVR